MENRVSKMQYSCSVLPVSFVCLVPGFLTLNEFAPGFYSGLKAGELVYQ